MKLLLTSLLTIFCAALAAAPAQEPAAPAIIPQPATLVREDGTFTLTRQTTIFADGASRPTADMLAERLRRVTGYPLKVRKDSGDTTPAGDIRLTTKNAKSSLGHEGYELTAEDAIVIRAPESAGVFYGMQTLLQLLPPQVFAAAPSEGVTWSVPRVRIEDQPRFSWRGMMLDTGRHFFKVADVKTMLDAMALHKLNVFHWHLTDDQGWRIEIKKYPKLTQIGAWRDSSPPYGDRRGSDGKRYGGFYTQKDIKDVVAYAAARHITVVPEIEMPGHASAAIASYPELGNSDVPGYAPHVMTTWGVHPYTFAPKEETFKFLENVLTEVCKLFPSTIIHIGGDEAPKTQWQQSAFAQQVMRREGLKDEQELQSWFISHIEKFLASKGRRIIGWDEIQEGGLPKTATMMVWRDAKWAHSALALGNNVVMATTSNTYLDYYQAPAASELAKGVEYENIGGFLPLEKVYAYEPDFVAESPEQEKQILGTQGQLWTEYIQDVRKLEYNAFPRLSALAEVAWSPKAARNYDDFLRRLPAQYQRFDAMGVNHFPDVPVAAAQ
jgi:hexosaminidase